MSNLSVITTVFSGVARGAMGAVRRVALLGGGKIGVVPKKLEREQYFEGYKNFRKGTAEP